MDKFVRIDNTEIHSCSRFCYLVNFNFKTRMITSSTILRYRNISKNETLIYQLLSKIEVWFFCWHFSDLWVCFPYVDPWSLFSCSSISFYNFPFSIFSSFHTISLLMDVVIRVWNIIFLAAIPDKRLKFSRKFLGPISIHVINYGLLVSYR